MKLIQELFKDTSDLIEIRELGKAKRKQLFFNSESIKEYIPPEEANIYFGVYGRKDNKSGKADNCNDTKALWCDIDNFDNDLSTPEKIKEVKKRIARARLPEASVMVNSGNGMHLYWLLNKRASKGIVGLNKAIAKVLQGDIRATDKARILRLPDTNNVKDKSNIKRCEIVQANYGLKYDTSEFKEILKDNIPKEIERLTRANKGFKSGLIDTITPDRPCIEGMLKGVTEGERNFALGRITKWLQVKGYTKKQAKEIITEWNYRNVPPESEYKLVSDFYQYWKGDYKLLGCISGNGKGQQILYKYCNRLECNFNKAIGNIKLVNSIEYNNRLLSDLYKISGNDLIVYGLLVRHKEGLTTSLLIQKLTSRALDKPCISKPTRLKSLDTLNKLGFIEIVEGNRRKGLDNLYKAIPQGNYGLGYTLLSNGAINGAIDKRVTSGELKLYTLLLKYAYNKGNSYPSLDTLAKELRTSINYISNTLKELEKVDYIKRTYKVFNGIEKLEYKLLI